MSSLLKCPTEMPLGYIEVYDFGDNLALVIKSLKGVKYTF